MSHNLNSVKMGYIRDPNMGAITGDTMSLDTIAHIRLGLHPLIVTARRIIIALEFLYEPLSKS